MGSKGQIDMEARKLIGVFGSEVSARIQGNLYKELHRKAQECGYNLMIFSGTYDKVSFRTTMAVTSSLFGMAANIDFAAFIVHAQSISDMDIIQELIALGKSKQIPVFIYDGEMLGITSSDGVITLNPNYKQGFADSVRHLIEYHNCKNIFMLAGVRNNKYSDDRIAMYRQEMDAHGIPFDEKQIGYGDFWENPAMEAVNQFLDSGLPTPEAICCANDSMAITAVKVLKQRGYRVPEDVLVTGFDGIEDGKYNFPNISTCEPRLETVSEFIFNVLEGKDSSNEFRIPLKFYPKESCGCKLGFDLEEKREMTSLVDNMRVNTWQHNMLATMQFELIDSTDLNDIVGFMNGTLDLLKDYSHMFCFKEDIEYQTDYTEKFDKMRVQMSKGILENNEFNVFDVQSVFPNFEKVMARLSPEDIFFLRLIHNGDKLYGYHIVKGKEYSSNNLRLISQFTESVTIVIESILRNKRLNQANQKLSEMYQRMSEMYIRDTMTGLYNRHGYYQKLDEYMKREDLKNGYVHVVSIDMDGMKHINDNYGHLEGDHAIKSVAVAIEDCFSQPCISARFGGDEFSVALFTETEEPATEKLSAKMNHYLANLPILADKEYKVVVSVGQAVAKLSEVEDFKYIEKLADDSMYVEKRQHKKEINA